VRDAVKKKLPEEAPKPGKFRLPGGNGEPAAAAAEGEIVAAAQADTAQGA
jgi:large subunit ribosomal protein L3